MMRAELLVQILRGGFLGLPQKPSTTQKRKGTTRHFADWTATLEKKTHVVDRVDSRVTSLVRPPDVPS